MKIILKSKSSFPGEHTDFSFHLNNVVRNIFAHMSLQMFLKISLAEKESLTECILPVLTL